MLAFCGKLSRQNKTAVTLVEADFLISFLRTYHVVTVHSSLRNRRAVTSTGMSFHCERNKRMSEVLSAPQRLCKSVKAAATVLTLAALALTLPGTLYGQGRGKNKD